MRAFDFVMVVVLLLWLLLLLLLHQLLPLLLLYDRDAAYDLSAVPTALRWHLTCICTSLV
jgi:hypothetical protein